MRKRTRTIRLGVSLLALAAVCAGCDDAAKRQAHVRPPVETIEPELPAGPLPAEPRYDSAALLPPRPGVEVLIEKVRAVFAEGERESREGNPESARIEFDRAIRWIQLSGYDPRSNPRLDDLYNHIEDALHSQELEAINQGEGLEQPPSEPAPIDEIADLTFPLDPRLKEKVERELADVPHDLPIAVNDEVLSYLNFFQTRRGRAIVEHGLQRAGRYREMINRTLRDEGLPQDLIYVAQAESAFQPLALSRARALGVWQFMSYSAREYGLAHTWWVDERQDPERSTRAAARYLRDLYQTFGDWYLALAAYNSGPASVGRAIERTGYADFWELHRRHVLPKQTRNYVPIILALTLMAKDPARYGLHIDPDPAIRGDRVKPGHPIDLHLVADTIDASLDSLKTLNPQLLRLVTPASAEFELQLPEGTAQRFAAEIAAIPPDKWLSWRRHRVEQGETLAGIARKYRVEPRAIVELNGLELRAELQDGARLTIPAAHPAVTGIGRLVRYRVRRGDTLASIAGQFDVAPADLRRWNGLKSTGIARGTTLKVYPGGRLEPTSSGKSKQIKAIRPKEERQTGSHAVQPGESLWSIAREYQTTVKALRDSNPFLAARQMRAGDKLAIPPSGCPADSQKTAC
jgi:membrane-bound lytic murein transglycosylase D